MTPKTSPAIARASGFSLIELMISITIGLLLIAGMATLLSNSSAHRAELEKSGRQIENGRYAMQILSEDLRHAGYYGEFYDFIALIPAIPVPATLPDACSTALADLSAALRLPVQGYDAPSTLPTALSTCIGDANHADGTDVLVVRRTSTVVNSSSLVAGRVYLQTRNDKIVMADGSAVAATWNLTKKDLVTQADIRQYVVHIYFVSPCSVPASGSSCTGASDDGGKPIPTLKRLELTNTGTSRSYVVTPLVEGIENLQIDYGTDSMDTGSPNNFVTSPADTTAWSNVVSTRLQLVARNTDATTGFTDTKTYNMGLAGTYTPASAVQQYKRHAYAQLVRLENPSARREQ